MCRYSDKVITHFYMVEIIFKLIVNWRITSLQCCVFFFLFLPYNNVHRPQAYIYHCLSSLPLLPPQSSSQSYPSRSSQRTGLSFLCYTVTFHKLFYMSQRRAMPKNVQTTAQLYSFHMPER